MSKIISTGECVGGGAGGGGAAADREEGSSRDEPLNQFYLNGNLNKEALHRSFRNRFSFLRR